MGLLNKAFIRINYPFFYLVFGWLGYTLLFICLKQQAATLPFAGILSLAGETCLDLIAVLLCYNLITNRTRQQQSIFKNFLYAFIFAAIADFSYNLIVNVFQITHYSQLLEISFEWAFIGFLVFLLLGWVSIAGESIKQVLKSKSLSLYLPFCFIVGIIMGIFSAMHYSGM